MALAVPANYLSPPSRIINQAIDLLGESGQIIGSITDGTPVAEAARRAYGQGLRALLRTAWWDFARKRDTLTLLGDITGSSAPPVSTTVECPWTYAYAWPNDGVMGRWLPWNPTNAQPTSSTGVPLTTGVSAVPLYWSTPGRFLVSSSDQYPIETGFLSWDQLPDISRTEGLGPNSRKIILTDCCNAEFVYTRLVPVIEEWDSLFREAFVTMMALAIAPTAIKDPKTRLAVVPRLQAALKNAVDNARVANGNESGFPQSVDTLPLWLRSRNYGWGADFPGGGGALYSGYTYFPWDSSMSWCGSVY